MTTRILESNKKSFPLYIESTTDMPIRTEHKSTINIKNNYIHTTKIETEAQTLDGEVVIKATTTFYPYYLRIPSGKVCKGQSWKDTSKHITKYTIQKSKSLKEQRMLLLL